MDHLLFLAQERMESMQVSLRSMSSSVAHGYEQLRDGAHNSWSRMSLRHNNLGQDLAHKIQEMMRRLREILSTLKPEEIYQRFMFFVFTEMTKAHMYFGGFCFIVGGTIGIVVGMRLRASIVAPQKMRAVVANSYKGVESILVVEDMLAPRIVEPYQVLVQVKSAGIDYLDIKVAEGYARVLRKQLNKYNPNNTGEFPVVLGRDCAGIVVAVGKEVSRVDQGDEVWLAVPVFHPGTMSEYIVVNEEFLSLKPRQLTFEGAAALPYNIMTAWDALVRQAGLNPETSKGKRVLIHAGASGIGVVGIQLAKAWGAHVTTTVTTRAAPLVHMLGADDVITFDNSNFDKELLLREKYDVILNTVGQVLHESSTKHCLPGGMVVTTTMCPLASDSYGYISGALYSLLMRCKYFFTKAPWQTGSGWGTIRVAGQVLDTVSPMVESGRLQAVVDKAYSAQDAEVAFNHIGKGEQIGKTVLRFRARPLAARMEGSY
ncbi:NAD(P)H oxidoreductase RTN4IP1, mitochondrial-like isoform X2 [Oratosquilla oratoria]|uniref:NAD(P)H oxidoreductase RTN4IP1, mitochondrial-like isoform X2 n=1 Tax=Oratosquilla oratoria TaxID=337810 RepID=UPI003F7646E4